MEATYVEDDSQKKRVLKTARALIDRDGTAFTVSALCEECGLNRSQFRRLYPTKANLLDALAKQVVEKSKSKNTAPRAREIKEDFLERRLRVLEKAITSLETRLDTGVRQESEPPVAAHPEASVIGVVAFQKKPDAPSRHLSTLELPVSVAAVSEPSLAIEISSPTPEIYSLAASEPDIAVAQTALKIEMAAIPVDPVEQHDPLESVPDPELPPILEIPPLIEDPTPGQDTASAIRDGFPYTPVFEPEVMRAILNKARAQAGHTADVSPAPPVSFLEKKNLPLYVSVAAVVFGLLIGILSIHHVSRSVQKSNSALSLAQKTNPTAQVAQKPNSVKQAVADAPAFTIINATGNGEPISERIKSLATQAAHGDARSQSKLALAYLRGDGVGIDQAAAIGWSQLAAAQGEPSAQFTLGTLYANGIKPDPQLAVRWFAAAATRGNVKAMHNLAIAYLNGRGVSKNTAAALNWFGKAATAGYRDSAFDLAVLYERGEGVRQDPKLALRWYNVAASHGDAEAAQRIELLKTALTRIARR
jgi:AcrR family transcriptional regulator